MMVRTGGPTWSAGSVGSQNCSQRVSCMKTASTSSQGKAAGTFRPAPSQPRPMGGTSGPLLQLGPSGPAQAISMIPFQALTPGSAPWAEATPQLYGLVAEVEEYEGQKAAH